MEEVKRPEAPTVKQFEAALSAETVPQLQHKALAMALNALASGSKQLIHREKSYGAKPSDVLDNPEVFELLVQSNTLVTLLKTIEATGGSVDTLSFPADIPDEMLLKTLEATPNLKHLVIPPKFKKYSELKNLIHLETVRYPLYDIELDDFCAILEAAPNLREVEVCYLPFQKLDRLEELLNLDTLKHLTGHFHQDLDFLKRFTGLKSLDLSGTLLHDRSWKFLSDLTGLKKLDLSRTDFYDVKVLADLKDLKHLSLRKATMVNSWPLASKMPALEYLNLSDTNIRDLSQLKEQQELIELVLEDCYQLKDVAPLLDLKSLRVVRLTGTEVDPDVLSSLQQLTVIKDW